MLLASFWHKCFNGEITSIQIDIALLCVRHTYNYYVPNI